jgi:hypothetical protein
LIGCEVDATDVRVTLSFVGPASGVGVSPSSIFSEEADPVGGSGGENDFKSAYEGGDEGSFCTIPDVGVREASCGVA